MAYCSLVLVLVLLPATIVSTTCDPPCVHGECVMEDGGGKSYDTCRCTSLWFGGTCSEFICDHPEATPCRNGATCQSLANYTDYECQCAANYSGEYCTVSHFNCSNTTCSGHGNCSDNSLDPSGYQCECDVGFSGSNCEENIDDCVGVDCSNGTCVDGISSYYCSCNVNYTGSHCEDLDYCAIHVAEGSNGCDDNGVCCFNGGTCVNVPEEERHTCACPPPWLPTFSCLRRAVLCADDPCYNDATCEDNGLEYNCTCPSGFIGRDCDVVLRECVTNPCQNNASCLEVGVQQYCRCLPYTTGEMCESRYDPCDGTDCHNGGSCVSHVMTDGYATECQCADGYTGPFCSSDIDECSQNDFCNGAKCINLDGSFRCNCTSGFTGDHCQINMDICTNVPCQNKIDNCLSTSDLTNDFECDCVSGYNGKHCQWLTNQTCAGTYNTSFGCTAGHTANCIDHFIGLDGRQVTVGREIVTVGFECRCNDGFAGNLCEGVVPYCSRNPCTSPDRYERCITNYTNPSSPHCVCKTGYEGEECEIDVDLCENSPCLHNGTCQDHGTYHSCQCPPEYGGKDCSIEKCTDDTCNYAGSCWNSFNGPTCECRHGHTGSRCKTVLDPCDDNPCRNGGICNSTRRRFSCNCPVGYSGATCSVCLLPFCTCTVSGCEEKANNGICDDECNNKQCHWDNDECRLIKTEDPWSECTVMVNGRSCQDLFNNGVCDSECATTKCLLDGKDCLPKCSHRKCTKQFQNQRCNQKCNIQECLFDGGDCKSPDEVKLANGVITFTIEDRNAVTPNWKPFLASVGRLLNCIPIFEEVNKIAELEERTTQRWNMTVALDVGDCAGVCITSSSEAKHILNIHYSRGSFPPYPYRVTKIYSLPMGDHTIV